MKRISKWLLVVVLLVITASASNVIIYDPPTGKVIAYLLSVNTPDYEGKSNTLINPVLPPVPLEFTKVSNGVVIALSAAESNAVIFAALDAGTNATRSGASSPVTAFSVGGLDLRAIADVAKDEINLLRLEISIAKTNQAQFSSRPTMAPRTLQQFQNALTNKINSGAVD